MNPKPPVADLTLADESTDPEVRWTEPAPETRGWVGIAANAASGRGKGRATVDRLAQELDRLGIEARVAWTLDGRRELVDAADAVDSGCRCLVAVGGDGTVASLINECPTVPIAVVPAGTENLFARHFAFSRDPQLAARRIAEGHAETMDLGMADGRRFALMAGFGFDADVVGRHHAARLGRTGVLKTTHRVAYVEPVLRSSLGYRFPDPDARRRGDRRRHRDPDRDHGVPLQPAALRARPPVRPERAGGRRLPRPRLVSRSPDRSGRSITSGWSCADCTLIDPGSSTAGSAGLSSASRPPSRSSSTATLPV